MTVFRARARAVAPFLSFLVITTSALGAEAQPSASSPPAQATAGDKAMAEALFRAAKDLQAENKISEACAKYAESHRLDPKPGTILNVATCHELEGRTATAWADYSEAATFAVRARQAEREKFARGKIDELAKKLSYVTFEFPAVSDLAVLLDGKTLTPASAGTRMPIDPGDHSLEARAPGKVTWTSRVTIEPGPAERTVAVPVLAADSSAAAPAATAPSASADASARDGSTQRAVGWVAIGVGAAAVGAGAFFGLRTLSKKSTVDDHCTGSRCDDTGLRANDAAKDAATLSTIGFALGGAAVLTGVVLLVLAPSHSAAASAPARSASRVRFTGGGAVVVPEGGAACALQGVW